MAAPTVDAELERRAHLLGRGAEIQHLAAELDAVGRALVDGEVGAHGVRMRLDEPLEPETPADLLVGGRDEDQIAGAAPPLTGEARDGDRRRRHLALHVKRAPTP